MVRKNLTNHFLVPLCGTLFTPEERKNSVLHEIVCAGFAGMPGRVKNKLFHNTNHERNRERKGIRMQKERVKMRRVVSGIFTALAVMIGCCSTAYAVGEDEAVRILIQNESLFESNTIGGNILRYIGWG